MIFQHTHAYIWQPSPHTGKLKTQTRRIVKPGEFKTPYGMAVPDSYIHAVRAGRRKNGTEIPARDVYRVGTTYAVQPGRGQNALYYKRTPHGLSVFDYDSIPKDERPRNLKQYLDDEWLPLRIRITAIRREDVRDISDKDARAEGFATPMHYLATWLSMHDRPMYRRLFARLIKAGGPWWTMLSSDYERGIMDYLRSRPAHLYDAWVLTFEAEAQP